MSSPRIYYLIPDYAVPSWGVGLLYHHVRLLRERGFDAIALLPKQGLTCPDWLDVDVPVTGLDAPGFEPTEQDLLVVPEVMAHEATPRGLPCRRIVFIQGSFLILHNVPEAIDYRALGYEGAMAVMPHICEIVADHFGLRPRLVPPFVAPHFFADESELTGPRPHKLLLVGKPEYLKAGYLDYDIARKVLQRQIDRLAEGGGPRWQLMEPSGLSHRDFAQLMKQSALMLNVNTLESFNATVPEAMAAGCVVFCYEAYGGRDYLRAGENAHVWPNNHIYPLLGQLCDLLAHYEERQAQLAVMRKAAADTARRYQQSGTADALERVFGAWLA